MKRRDFIMLLSSAVIAWPLAARAQQPGMPVVGFLGTSSPDAEGLRAFHLGLKETGYVEGENVTILQRWTEGSSPGSAAGSGSRSGSTAGRRDRELRQCCCTGGQGCDDDDPNRLRR
jgi:hypothetical protein